MKISSRKRMQLTKNFAAASRRHSSPHFRELEDRKKRENLLRKLFYRDFCIDSFLRK